MMRAAVLSLALLMAVPLSAQATHSWSTYHWARTANPVTLRVIDSMTKDWDANLDAAIADWNASAVLNVVEERGSIGFKTRKNCLPVLGTVHACNAKYGNYGWLGMARVWISGGHIIQATAKMNDSYLTSSSYSYSEVNRQHVICQEIGHAWGLGHQDEENGADLNSCMDSSDALDNPDPNAHDYEQLETIYAHLDSTTTVRDLGGGDKVLTHVIWAP